MALVNLPVPQLQLVPALQSRERIDLDVVAEYAEFLTENPSRELPPIRVFFFENDGAHVVADGFHRKLAYERAGRKTVPAIVQEGDMRQALLYSCSANQAHGLRRTNADKRLAVRKMLGDEEWSTWSDRRISQTVGVSHTFVGSIRTSVTGGNGDHIRKYERSGQEHIATVKLNPDKRTNEQDRSVRRVLSAIVLLSKQSADKFDAALTEPQRKTLHDGDTLRNARAFLDSL